MKEDTMYPYYINYLEFKLNIDRISIGELSIMKLSGSAFNEFKQRFENDELFQNKIVELYKIESRDKKINELLDDFD
jgi:hypothetical protein